jgi:uncharacterized protein
MKFVVLLLVLVGAMAWLAVSRRQRPPQRPDEQPAEPPRRSGGDRLAPPQAMVSCAHCGVHLPQADALLDAAGRPYCGEAHRQAGPRPGA